MSFIADGSVISAHRCSSLDHNSIYFFSKLSCSKVTDSICYSTAITTGVNHTVTTQINFSSLGSIKYSDISGTSYTTTTISAVNDEEVIGSGHEFPTTMDYTFYRYSFTADNYTWAVSSAGIGKSNLAYLYHL